MKAKILFEDRNIIVVEKPPKMPCQSDKTLDEDLMSILINHCVEKEVLKEKPYLGLVHRLDRPVGGVLVLAKTKEANRSLSKQISEQGFLKEYLTIVCGKPSSPSGEFRDYLKKLITINMSKVVPQNTKGSKEAILKYQLIDTVKTNEYGELSLMSISLETGRHHQIRVQLSNAGIPIWGDNKYNKTFIKKKEWSQISLWAHKLAFKHPSSNELVTFYSYPYDEYPWNIFHIKKRWF